MAPSRLSWDDLPEELVPLIGARLRTMTCYVVHSLPMRRQFGLAKHYAGYRYVGSSADGWLAVCEGGPDLRGEPWSGCVPTICPRSGRDKYRVSLLNPVTGKHVKLDPFDVAKVAFAPNPSTRRSVAGTYVEMYCLQQVAAPKIMRAASASPIMTVKNADDFLGSQHGKVSGRPQRFERVLRPDTAAGNASQKLRLCPMRGVAVKPARTEGRKKRQSVTGHGSLAHPVQSRKRKVLSSHQPTAAAARGACSTELGPFRKWKARMRARP
ncbi:hypothetical protein PR202_ga19978 [Eleusine coracana subsp. coracana]|uniref:Uncharacterized protein n=1 Tax=Eleusine coracana subsp. coracana TaxID=191504 RepID=A0AAV5CVL2_ELECO|nr:hypothetical protein PR202_ga19978 [Eleusine coracana subsp. coracana]